VAAGDKVSEGDGLVIISSMKMESTVEAESDGIVEEVYVNPGQAIEAGHIMLKLALKEE
jgi:biotin carboxyl carrier protein